MRFLALAVFLLALSCDSGKGSGMERFEKCDVFPPGSSDERLCISRLDGSEG